MLADTGFAPWYHNWYFLKDPMGRGTISAHSPRSQTAEYYVGGREMAGLCICVCACVCARAR